MRCVISRSRISFSSFKIEDHSGDRIRFAGDGDFQRVVVAVAMRIVALAEDAPVLFRGQTRDCGSRCEAENSSLRVR